MTTETTTSLPPCPLPDCEGGEHHFHRLERHPGTPERICTQASAYITRCYGAHQPAAPIDLPEITDEMVELARNCSMFDTFGELRSFAVAIRLALLAAIPQWQPIEHDQIKAGMRIRATATAYRDCVTTRTGVAHRTNDDGNWRTERNWPLTGWPLTGWADPISYEVDPATIPDPDAELIEKIGKAIHDADESDDEWGEDPSAETLYRKLARAALNAVRESEVTA